MPESARIPADDDELPELPAIDGDDDAVLELEIGSDDDLDDADLDENGDLGGLDVSTGIEDDDDALDALGDDEAVDSDWDASDEPVEEDSELDDGDEGGWTSGSEAADAPGWDTDLDSDDDDDAPTSDQGEEGVEERIEGGGEDDAVDLPLAARGEEELAEDLELEEEGEIESMADERPEHPALSLPRAGADRVTWTWLGPANDAIVAIGGGLAGGRTLYRIDGDRAVPLEGEPLGGDASTSITRTAGGAWIVGLRIGGALRSSDGVTFERLDGLRRGGDAGPLFVLAERSTSGVRLWGRTRGGALARSDDDGETWSRPLIAGSVTALALAADGGVVGVLGARHGPLRIMRTLDGGRSWRSGGGPTVEMLPDETEIHVAALGHYIAVACEGAGQGPFVSSDEGQRWSVLEPVRDAGPLAIVQEGDAVALYAGVLSEGLDRGLVIRVPLAGDPRGPEIVLDLEEVRRKHHVAGAGDSDGDQRIHALVVEEGAAGTTLLVGSGLGVVRVRVRGPGNG